MTTPVTRRQIAHPDQTTSHHRKEWRCTRCDKLLGICRDGRLHLRFGRGHEYFVSFPAVATCRGCGTLNQATAPSQR